MDVVGIRKPYEKPTFTKLTPEQSKLKLLGLVSKGHEGAKELLELMFSDVPSRRDLQIAAPWQPVSRQVG